MMNRFRTMLSDGEEGHVHVLVGPLISAAGAIVLAIGAANANDATTITGGIVLAVGFVGGAAMKHGTVEKDVYGRIDKLEEDD